MDGLKVVFRTIRDNCDSAGMSTERCSSELAQLVAHRQLFFPVYFYTDVLLHLGSITIDNHRISLTEKGRDTSVDHLADPHVYTVLLQSVLKFSFFVLLFWPALLFPSGNTREEKSEV